MVKKEFSIERQGQTFAKYAGLLDAAHSQGLTSIKTKMLQAPSAENGQTCIFFAKVILEPDGADELSRRVFTGIGDANPANVGPTMKTCLIRFAETRAKARALRDAINFAGASVEEMDDEDMCGSSQAKPVTNTPAAKTQTQTQPKAQQAAKSQAVAKAEPEEDDRTTAWREMTGIPGFPFAPTAYEAIEAHLSEMYGVAVTLSAMTARDFREAARSLQEKKEVREKRWRDEDILVNKYREAQEEPKDFLTMDFNARIAELKRLNAKIQKMKEAGKETAAAQPVAA